MWRHTDPHWGKATTVRETGRPRQVHHAPRPSRAAGACNQATVPGLGDEGTHPGSLKRDARPCRRVMGREHEQDRPRGDQLDPAGNTAKDPSPVCGKEGEP